MCCLESGVTSLTVSGETRGQRHHANLACSTLSYNPSWPLIADTVSEESVPISSYLLLLYMSCFEVGYRTLFQKENLRRVYSYSSWK